MDHFLHIQNGAILLNPLKVKRIPCLTFMREAVRTSDIHERGGLDVGHSCLYINCHVVIFAETMDQRELEQEQLLGEIILAGGDAVLSFLNDTDGTMEEEEGHDHDGSGDMIMMAPEVLTS